MKEPRDRRREKAYALWLKYFLGDNTICRLPPEYLAKIVGARFIYFRRKIRCSEPQYLMLDMGGVRAMYIPPKAENFPHSIVFSELMLRNYTDKELSGALAHEIAHAERVKKYGKESRQEWEVDLAALDFVSPENLIACHIRSRIEVDKFFVSNEDFGKYKTILFAYNTWCEENEKRIKKLKSRI